MIYRIENDFENCYSFLPDGSDLLLKMPSYSQRFRAKPRLEHWVAPIASYYASENYAGQGEQLPDVTTWAIGNIVLSPKAYEVFKDLLAPSGEFLPVHVGIDTYYIFNTLYVIPEEGIDRSHAVEAVDAGVHTGQERVLFRESVLSDHHVFKSPTNKLSYSFVTEAFKRLYVENSFSGLVFRGVK
ncbi:MAG: hypothetical protein K6L76_04975 [Agarilytica sp.]